MAYKFGLSLGLLLFLTLGVTRSRQQDSFYFDPSPVGGEVVEGDATRLRCDVSNRRHITFYWVLNDRPVANDSRRFQEDSDLRVLRVDRQLDAGPFRCIATNVSTGMSLRSLEARLEILWIDKEAKVQLRNKEKVEAGVDLALRCQAEGNPEPLVEWYRNKERLFESEHIRIHKTRLKVTSVTAEHNGVYSCKAKNLGGEVDSSQNYLLNVQEPAAAHLDTSTFTQRRLVAEGGEAAFDCQYGGALLTEWYNASSRLTNSSRVTVFGNGTLSVRRVSVADAGVYKCVGLSESGPPQAFVAALTLAYLDPLKKDHLEPPPAYQGRRLQPTVVPFNSKYEVRCAAPPGLPAPETSWVGPSDAVLPAVGRVRAEKGQLTVNNAQPEDSGNYSCRAANMAGTVDAPVWIVVSVAPAISKRPLSQRLEEGETATFSCSYTGTPAPVTRVTWVKEDLPLDSQHPRFEVDEAKGTLKILDVHLADEGNYACVVNTTGHPARTSTNAHLYVKRKLKFRPRPVNTMLELSSTAKIHCRADGQTVPIITWFKNGKPDFPEHTTSIGGTLLFNGVRHTDAGNYTCEARSAQGVINATITVAVVVRPQFKVPPQNATAYEGYPVMIHCVAVGDPTPTTSWDKNNKVNAFDLTRFKLMTNGSLFISEAYMEDIGRYGCTAGNSGGLLREEIYLNVLSAESHRRDGATGVMAENFNMMKTIIIAVCSAVAYLAIVIGLTVYCSIRLLKAKQRKAGGGRAGALPNPPNDKAENGTVPTEHTELMDKKERDTSSVVKVLMSDDARSHVSGVSSQHSSHSHPSSSHNSSRSGSTRHNYDKLAFPRHDLQTLGMLGKSHYGDVFLAKAHNIKEAEAETLVVVKSLLTREEQHHLEFRREMDMFGRVKHENVVRLLGLCREMEPQFLITEYCEWGDLKQFLWATRQDNGKRGTGVKLPALTLAQKVSMCQQVALGLEQLAAQRLVHRDVAARNVLLTPSMHLKLANLALCRDVYASDYVPLDQRLVPLRWMAPEAVLEDEFTSRSDVWAYACFVYEVFTLADQPHKELGDQEVLKALRSTGQLLAMERPPTCPVPMWDVMRRCMLDCPKDRPSFSDISIAIGALTVDSDV